MIFIALVIGAVLIVAAVRNSQGDLFNALGQDVPAFVVWGAAIFAVGALGYVPGLKGPSRALLALVILVLIVNNYSNVLAGFSTASQPQTGSSAGKSTGSSAGSIVGSLFSSGANALTLTAPNAPSVPIGSPTDLSAGINSSSLVV